MAAAALSAAVDMHGRPDGMGGRKNAGGGVCEDMAKILLMVPHGPNRDLIAACLAHNHEVIGVEDDDLGKSFDLGIVDARVLSMKRGLIVERRHSEDFFLPFMAVVSRKDVTLISSHLWEVVDDLVTAPIMKIELCARVEILLRARRLSIEVREHEIAGRIMSEAKAELERMVEERTAELRASNDRLMELDRLKNMFIAAMSHELRTPLNAIIGFTGVMLQGISGEITKEQQKQLGIVMDSARHLKSLIDGLIDVGRIESGWVDMHPEDVDVEGLVREVAGMMEAMASSKGVRVEVRTRGPLGTLTDRKLLKQVLVNIVGNAVKFTERGVVSIDAARERGVLVIEVRDTGRGIPAERMEDLFAPFCRIEPDQDKPREGAGIGLYLSKKIVNHLGGDICAESTYGQGSTFKVMLPAGRAG